MPTPSTSPTAAPATPTNKKMKERLFTPQQLKAYDGKDGSKGPYLAILGRVYNVRKGKKHYGPGGGYEFFSGIASVGIREHMCHSYSSVTKSITFLDDNIFSISLLPTHKTRSGVTTDIPLPKK